VAKKRKASRPSSSKGKKMKSAKKPARRAAARKTRTGLESSKEVDFRPLKMQIRAHIDRLGKAKDQTPAVANALRSLQQLSETLSVECSPSMIIPTS
jgi:hypothetical protein